MRFEYFPPSEALRPYIKHFVVSENGTASAYKVLPSPGIVIGFQYRGKLAVIREQEEIPLSSSGVTGINDRFSVFKNTAGTGSILVYFTETGFTRFSMLPAHELFNVSTSLEDVFGKDKVAELEDRLSAAGSDLRRIQLTENFFLTQMKDIEVDKLIIEAVRMIYQNKGTLRIKTLAESLHISQSPFEKRFRKMVGASPKKFSSIIRFNAALSQMDKEKSLTEICYEHHFFDQAHFIKDFRQFTGETPETFRRQK